MVRKNAVWLRVWRASLGLAVAVGILLLGTPLLAQTTQGTIQGSVVDQSGGAVAGAMVTIIDPARGINRPLTTDSAGQYQLPNVTPGTYTVRVEANGFQTVQQENVNVEVGQTSRIDITLQPGAQTQTVTVTSEALAVNTTDATLGGTVNNQAISNLPLNGRNYQRLLLLRPGVVGAIGGGTGGESSNGLKSGENMTLLEGVAALAQSTGGSVLNSSYHQGDSASLLPLDAISEFNIQQNPKAEYGWRDGAVTNIGIKSGTNTIHGTAYAFGRDTALDAANPFTGIRPPISLQQYGASAGGRIIKDKFFWFVAYEKMQNSIGDGASPTIPYDLPKPGGDTSFSMVDACNSVGRANVNPLSALLAGLPAGSCVPQSPSVGENAFPYNPTLSNTFVPGSNMTTVNPIHNGVAKLDYNLSDKIHFAGTFFIGYSNALTQLDPGQLEPQWLNNSLTRTEAGTGSFVWTPNSSWVNEFRGGVAVLNYRGLSVDVFTDPSQPWPAGYGIPTGINLSGNPLYGGFPQIQITGMSGFLGQGQRNAHRGPEGTQDIVDNVSYLHGKHAFKFGFEYLDSIAVNDQINYGNGNLVFSNLSNFLQGIVNKGIVLVGNPATDARGQSFAGFLQDDWRVKPRLTLNLGLRYEYNLPPTEKNNFLGNFYPNGIMVDGKLSPIGQAGGPFPALYKANKDNFAPRFGLAWDVQGDGKTVVRAGAGMYYSMEEIGQLIQLNPFGANIPQIGLNTSGQLINTYSPDQLALQGCSAVPVAGQPCGNFFWNLTGPVFPVNPSVTINGTGFINGAGAFPGTYSGLSCTYLGEPGLPPTSSYSPTPCSIAGSTNPNFRTPWAAEWTLDIQRAITRTLTIEAAYVGNHGREASRIDINQPPFGWGWTAANSGIPGGISPAAWCLASATDAEPYDHCGGIGTTPNANTVSTALKANETTGRPYNAQYPYISYIDETGNLFYSNYNALQITVTERASHGLTLLAGYTLSHALDTFSSGTFQGKTVAPPDVHQVGLSYANSDSDSRNRFTLSATYQIPGKKVPGQLLEGWAISPIVALYSGVPWSPFDTTNDISGIGEISQLADNNMQPWNYTGPKSAFTSGPGNVPCYSAENNKGATVLSGCIPYAGASATQGGTPPAACLAAAQANGQLAVASLYNYGCYVKNGGVLTPAGYGQVGSAGRNQFRGPNYYNMDFSVSKDWKFRERYGAQFRFDVFNIFNRADYAQTPTSTNPAGGGQFGCSCSTPDETGFTNAVLGSGAPRSMQLGLKLSF